MLKTPNSGFCPRCEAELEPKDEVAIGNKGWLRENCPYDEDEWDRVQEDHVKDCPNCSYRYP